MRIVDTALKTKKFRFQKNTSKNSLGEVIENITLHGYPNIYHIRIGSHEMTTEIMYTSFDFTTMINTLTAEEKSVALLLDAGYDGKTIANHLGKSPSTVSRMIATIRLKMDEQRPKNF